MSSLGLRLTVLTLVGFTVACGASDDGVPADDSTEGALETVQAAPSPAPASSEFKLRISDTSAHGAVLSTGDVVAVQLKARDPIVKEVDNQADDIGAATITVARLAIQEDATARSVAEVDVQVRPGAAGTGNLTVVKPEASAVAALLKRNTRYRVSLTRNSTTTSTFFTEVDVTVQVR